MSRRLDGPPSGADGTAPPDGSHAVARTPRPPRRASGLRFAAPASLLLHLGLLAGLILWAEHRERTKKLALSPLDQGVKVVLMLEEHKGVRTPAQPVPPQPLHPPRPPASSPAPPAPVPPKAKPAPAKAPQAKPAEVQPPLPAPPRPAPPLPAPPEHAPARPASRPVPRSAAPPVARPSPVVPRPAPPSVAPPAPQPAPELNLGNLNDNETNALVKGDAVVPAKADDRYHNREPEYPASAVVRGEQGVVQLLIHVGPDGRPQDVEVARSSGYAALDRAARQAVLTWHFLPALKHGEAVAADMALRVVFHLK